MATRVLVVESDGLLAETYRRFLAREGFDVRTARTADECLSSFLEFAPDAIMLEPDVMASRAGAGSEFARNQTASIPIVVVTRQDLQRTDMPDTWHIVTLLLPEMPRLRELFFSGTDFNDRGISRLASLSQLVTLEADSTQVTDQGLGPLGRMSQLRHLSLANTGITDAGLKDLSNLSQLTQLNLSGTSISSAALVHAGFRKLRSLSLDRTQIADEGLEHLVELPEIISLSLASTDITDAGTAYLQRMKNLKHLDLTDTTVTLDGVAHLRKELPNCSILVTKFPQLTVQLAAPTPNAFFEKDASIQLTASTRATTGASVNKMEFLVDGTTVGVVDTPPFAFTWKEATVGRHCVEVRAYDHTDRPIESERVPVFVGVHGFERSIVVSDDDVEELEDGSIYSNSSDLELMRDGNRGLQVVGLRFRDISVPPGAKIKKAVVEFTAANVGKASTDLTIQAERSPNASPFKNENHNVTSRRKTLAFVKWSPPVWEESGEQSEKQATPDLSGIVAEIVSQPEWKSGNSLVLIISGKGYRNAVSRDGDSERAPRLSLEFYP